MTGFSGYERLELPTRLEQELGYFTIKELENLKGLFGLKVELDTSFKPTKLSKIKASI